MMEYIDVLRKIIETEKRARQIAENAAKQEAHLYENLEADIQKLRDEYEARVEKRLQCVREEEDKYTNEQLAAMEEDYRHKLYTLEKSFREQSEHWIEEMFREITAIGSIQKQNR